MDDPLLKGLLGEKDQTLETHSMFLECKALTQISEAVFREDAASIQKETLPL